MKRGILAFFGILGLWVYVSAGSEGMVRGSRAVGVSWDMGMAQGLRVGVWEGSEMVYCTTAASHLNTDPSTTAPTLRHATIDYKDGTQG